MGVFATEFPVRDGVTKADFVAVTLAWLKGMKNSTLNFNSDQVETYVDELLIFGGDGEKFALKGVMTSNAEIIGARHDIVSEGLSWRTECVLTSSESGKSLRVRGQSFSSDANIVPRVPKKPYLIKAWLAERLGGMDGSLLVTDAPHLLTSKDLEFAAKCVSGDFVAVLPVVYLSRVASGGYLLDARKLAFDLGGVAHVVVEPSVEFARDLADITDRANPYNGSIGYCIPGRGLSAKFYLGGRFPEAKQLEAAVRAYVCRQQAERGASLGWEWQALQAAFARRLRQNQVQSTNQRDKEWEDLVFSEIEAKDEEIANLKQRIDLLTQVREIPATSDGILQPSFVDSIGPELYENEHSDRLISLLHDLSTRSLDFGDRTRGLIERILKLAGSSGRSAALHAEIKSAGRDYRTSTERLKPILRRLGFAIQEDGGHVKAVPSPALFGVGQVTLARTPSDRRAGLNAVGDIMKALDIKK